MKLKKLKLTQVNSIELRKKEMKQLFGGQSCGCSCGSVSNTDSNYSANWYKGYSSSIGGGNKRCASSGDVYSRDNFG